MVNGRESPDFYMHIHNSLVYLLMQVLCQGQIIGGIVAETRDQARKAARCVKVEYEELTPIITIKVN